MTLCVLRRCIVACQRQWNYANIVQIVKQQVQLDIEQLFNSALQIWIQSFSTFPHLHTRNVKFNGNYYGFTFARQCNLVVRRTCCHSYVIIYKSHQYSWFHCYANSASSTNNDAHFCFIVTITLFSPHLIIYMWYVCTCCVYSVQLWWSDFIYHF